MDNLESQTYEVFERDPVKYRLYEQVRTEAIGERARAAPRPRLTATSYLPHAGRVGGRSRQATAQVLAQRRPDQCVQGGALRMAGGGGADRQSASPIVREPRGRMVATTWRR